MLSFGVPLLLGGDELGRTQQGNNNAYCQDNAITWFDWSHADAEPAGVHQALIALRRPSGVPPQPVPGRHRRPGAGLVHPGGHGHDRGRLGRPQRPQRWPSTSTAPTTPTGPPTGAPLDDDFLVLVNAWWEPLGFTLPVTRGAADERVWQLVVHVQGRTGPAPCRRCDGSVYGQSPVRGGSPRTSPRRRKL